MASSVEKEPSPGAPNIQSLLLTDHNSTPKMAQCSSEAEYSAAVKLITVQQ